jgi:hypothetical protein
MASSPSHRFGQIVGELLEEIMAPQFQAFCDGRGLFLDKKGTRGAARGGTKVAWLDKYGNSHDLDFVIEKGGTEDVRGRPIAFIEAAWRRYTKHSRNKAQEIQGAVLPIAEKHEWDQPFLGAILAGVFTQGSLDQMRSSGFKVALFPYESIVAAFLFVGIDAAFDEATPDSAFQRTIDAIEALAPKRWDALKKHLTDANSGRLQAFFAEFEAKLDRQIEQIVLTPLHGHRNEFDSIADAVEFVDRYQASAQSLGGFKKYEIVVKYSNGDKIEADFQNARDAVSFLRYVQQGAA